MKRFDTREAARIVALPERSIRACVRAGCLSPERDADGRLSFGFRDLSVLRTARRLFDSGLPASRVTRALGTLRRQLPDDAHLSSVTVRADGPRVVASDGEARWEPDSGQVLMAFEAEGDNPRPATLPAPAEDVADAQAWFEAGCDLEADSPLEARAAYERAVELDPGMVDARLNLGRLLQQAGELGKAEVQYREAVTLAPEAAVPHFNLGVLLEERGLRDEAVFAYLQAIARAPDLADAHYNLSLLCEALGRRAEALKHLSEAKRLYEEGGG